MLDSVASHPDRSFPRLHPRPPSGWVNDPNGILHTGGRWHLFFQHNPASARHDRICWGHVSSQDLVTWQSHGIALQPQADGPDSFGCWSGVGLVDRGIPTAVYSGVVARSNRSQVVLARATSDAGVWTQEGIVAAGMPDDPDVVGVRDPFVFEFGGHRWAIQGAGLADGTGAVLLYGADDLESWEYHGVLLSGADDVAARLPDCQVWECPQLVRIGEQWVMLISLWRPGDHQGVAYLVGTLAIDEVTGLPVFTVGATALVDDGSCFYAPQAVQSTGADGQPERVLVWAWAEEKAPPGVTGRTAEDLDAVGWSGLLTFPRELRIHDDVVELRPARELLALRGEPCDPGVLPDQAEVVLRGGGDAQLRLGTDDGDGQLIWSGRLGASDEVRMFIDASLIEIHRRGGRSTTLRAYPEEGERYRVTVGGGVQAQAWELPPPD